jgi:ElaB/YqjD/DUF883 family membrane-anchored ribosome-binding protein
MKTNNSAGKGSTPRNCFSQEFRNNYEEIFRKGKQKEQKETEVKEKQKKELCPHCATMNFVQESPWVSKCLKCRYEKK